MLPFHADILQSEVFIKTQTYADLALLFSSPYIGLAFINTMIQNHSTSDGIPGWDQIDNPVLNIMGQYHGYVPWFYKFRAQIGIHYLVRTFPRTYTTSPLQTRVCFVTYHIYHFSGTY